VVNVTPDSFSDGGLYGDPTRALDHARQLAASGAAVIDVGAESTRPGAKRVSVTDEIDRLRPVVTALVDEGYPVSVDTMNAETAREAIGWGVSIINDVSGGLADPEMMATVSSSGVRYVMMHWRGHSDTMDDYANYDNVVSEVVDHLESRVMVAKKAGIDESLIMVDPGFGFAKNAEHNWSLARGIDRVVALGYPVLAGVSRKRFIASLLPADHDMSDRDAPSAMVGALLARSGVSALRVHSVWHQQNALEIMTRMGVAENV
jgi:dihydropteroate synthase